MAGASGKLPRERVAIRLSPDGLVVVDQLAAEEERSRSDTIRMLVMEALEARKLIPPRHQPRKVTK